MRALRLLAFTGAGLSRESGLATFRGEGGLWERFRPEEVATPEAFARDPELVWRWYKWRFGRVGEVLPNDGHREIARWQELFASVVVVTQNVDGLHQVAGSRDVLELHGSMRVGRCARCGRERPMGELMALAEEPPACSCGGLFRPGVVWFGESLPEETFARAVEAARRAEVFVAIGTSATVHPAAGLIDLAHRSGARIVEVNLEETPASALARRVYRGAASVELPRLTAELLARRETG